MDYYLNLIVLLTCPRIVKSSDSLLEPEALPNDPFRVFLPVRKRPFQADVQIPAEFDARKYWPYCPTIREIAFQGKCSSCWAIATTDVMSDRICIHSRGLEVIRLSAGNLLTCCDECGRGCKGGYPGAAWRYWITTGIVTGGFHKSNYGCQEYQIGPCTSTDHLRRTCTPEGSTPPCRRRCDRVGSGIFYHDDLHFGDSVYRIPNDVQQIQLEILLNGPVQTTIRIYEDLLTYRNGIYQHAEGAAKEFHAVKILGWGQENGVPYWLCANTWGEHWGEQGFFRILRGSNHAGIENNVMAGIPKLPKSLQKVRFS